jgi:WD40 repeat protein
MTPQPLALNPTDTRLERELKHPRPLTACRFDPSGRFVFAAGEDSVIRRFDLLTDEQATFSGHHSWVRSLAFLSPSPADAAAVTAFEQRRPGLASLGGAAGFALHEPAVKPVVVVSGDYHGRLLFWRGDDPSAGPIRAIDAHTGWLRAIAVSPDGTTLATCGNDHLVKLWTADGDLLRVLDGHDCHVYNVAFHPAGERLASADLKGVVKDWEVSTGKLERELDAKILHKYDTTFRADIGGARAMTFDPAGQLLACAGITNVSNAFAGVGNPSVVLLNWADGLQRQLKPKEAFQGTAWGVGFLPGDVVVAGGGGSGGRIWFWKTDSDESFHTVTTPTNIRDLALSPLGDRLAGAGANGSLYVYSLRPGVPPAAQKK